MGFFISIAEQRDDMLSRISTLLRAAGVRSSRHYRGASPPVNIRWPPNRRPIYWSATPPPLSFLSPRCRFSGSTCRITYDAVEPLLAGPALLYGGRLRRRPLPMIADVSCRPPCRFEPPPPPQRVIRRRARFRVSYFFQQQSNRVAAAASTFDVSFMPRDKARH